MGQVYKKPLHIHSSEIISTKTRILTRGQRDIFNILDRHGHRLNINHAKKEIWQRIQNQGQRMTCKIYLSKIKNTGQTTAIFKNYITIKTQANLTLVYEQFSIFLWNFLLFALE